MTAKLLETVPGLTMLASDVSAPSLEKGAAAARRARAERTREHHGRGRPERR
ncbi:MAG: hypothetical protein ACLUHE_04425 [Christensenellales bacterium]